VPRYNATFRFDADNLTAAQSFGRSIRSTAKDSEDMPGEWVERAARLLRIKRGSMLHSSDFDLARSRLARNANDQLQRHVTIPRASNTDH
jgi:hypothetical protein